MNFIEAIKAQRAIRRKDKPSHVGSHGTGWVDPYYFVSCCNHGMCCKGLHLTVDDILADDWEVYVAPNVEKVDE